MRAAWMTDVLSSQGASVEQIAAEVNKRQAALETARRDLKLMMQLNKVFSFLLY